MPLFLRGGGSGIVGFRRDSCIVSGYHIFARLAIISETSKHIILGNTINYDYQVFDFDYL